MDKGLISDLLKTPSQIRKENDQRRLTEGLAMAQLAQQGNTLGGVGGMFANFGAQQAAQTGRNISNAFRGVTDAIGTVTGADLRPADERAASAQQKAMAGLKMGNLQSMKAKRQELVNAGVPAAVIERLDSAIAKREAEVLQRSDTVQQRVQAQANADRQFGLSQRAEDRAQTAAEKSQANADRQFGLSQRADVRAQTAAEALAKKAKDERLSKQAVIDTADNPALLSALGFSNEEVFEISNAANKAAFVPAITARLEEMGKDPLDDDKLTADQKNYAMLESITDPKKRAEFARLIGADPGIVFKNLGDRVVAYSKDNPGVELMSADIEIAPGDTPEAKAAVALEVEKASQEGQFMGSYSGARKSLSQSLTVLQRAKQIIETNPAAARFVYGPMSLKPPLGESSVAWRAVTAQYPEAGELAALVDQIASSNFLIGYQELKGGGAITNIEGTKAETAISTLGSYYSLNPTAALNEIDGLTERFSGDIATMDARYEGLMERERNKSGTAAPEAGETPKPPTVPTRRWNPATSQFEEVTP